VLSCFIKYKIALCSALQTVMGGFSFNQLFYIVIDQSVFVDKPYLSNL